MTSPAIETLSPEEAERALAEDLASFAHDPLGFVYYAFPWGEPGTPLEGKDGPDEWQRENLEGIAADLAANPHQPVLDALAAANGVGKSAELAWVVLWAMSTHEDTRLTITASTATQLLTKTQPEIAKWHKLLICRHWFELTATQMYSREPGKRECWRADFVPWSKHNPTAFQGLHNEGKRLGVMVDEASGVDDAIFTAIEGSLTDAGTEIFFILRGNPTRRDGYFFNCFHRGRARWATRNVSSVGVAHVNQEQLAAWKEEHGEDSDFYRCRVLGQFPLQSSLQFIASEDVAAARTRTAESHKGDPLLIGCDVARHGGDRTVVAFRRGLDARSIPWLTIPFDDSEGYLMQVAARIAEASKQHGADMAFIDAGGMGWGVVDRLKQLRVPVHAINFGDAPLGCWAQTLPFKPKNRKMEIWGATKYGLKSGLAIPDKQELEDDLTGPHAYEHPDGSMFMESKDDMRARGLASPDWAEALCCTYGAPVQRILQSKGAMRSVTGKADNYDYDPFASGR